jgi:hypothetical protein
MVTRLRAFFVAALLASTIAIGGAAPKPALADGTFNPASPLIALFPDICSLFASCITFTDSTAINGMNNVLNQVQQGAMQLQELKSGPLGMLGGMGVRDPVSGNLLQSLLQNIARARTTNASMACNNSVGTAGAGNRTDLLSLFGVQRGSGIGNLSSGQITSVVEQKIAGEVEASNQCKAAEAVQQQANIQKSYYNMYDEMDLNGAPDAGWAL